MGCEAGRKQGDQRGNKPHWSREPCKPGPAMAKASPGASSTGLPDNRQRAPFSSNF